MLRHTNRFGLAALFAILFASFGDPNSSAQTAPQNHPMAMAIVEWSADLSGAKDSSVGARELAVQTRATGKVTATFDSDHKTITFQGQAKNIAGIAKIELRASRSAGDLSGPALLTLFDAHDGPFKGTFSKTVTSESFSRVAAAITNGGAAVVVTTAAHPDGEIAGFFVMHKHYQ
jgi:hypothetical protein